MSKALMTHPAIDQGGDRQRWPACDGFFLSTGRMLSPSSSDAYSPGGHSLPQKCLQFRRKRARHSWSPSVRFEVDRPSRRRDPGIACHRRPSNPAQCSWRSERSEKLLMISLASPIRDRLQMSYSDTLRSLPGFAESVVLVQGFAFRCLAYLIAPSEEAADRAIRYRTQQVTRS